MKCEKYNELAQKVESVLQKLVDITEAQRGAFLEQNHPRFTKLDKELELTVGEKERVIGAFRQHQKEHECQPKV
ncbi:MAG TPA: hypothetical protein VFE02_15810 [Candidatus Acidoferrales bacterium]|jgi:hypothetical protein|nr:hypothetical protein [Candidatus Acidoferrales bacterium]